MASKTETIKTVMEPLRWLFQADFQDDTSIVQDQDDKCYSRTDGTGSTFTDVLARESELVAFALFNPETKEVVSVDLITGNFTANGTPMSLHDQFLEPQNHNLRLVYFRETRVEQVVGARDGQVRNTRHYVNRYFIGWQTTVKGKNKQVTLAVG